MTTNHKAPHIDTIDTIDTITTIDTIDTTKLASVTGGGPVGWLIKGAKKVGPVIADKAVDAAKWTGIPSAIGGAAAWVKHKLDK